MNKYERWHDDIIGRARGRSLSEGEKHHIVPRSLGGSNESTNIVKLTYREHFLVHWLLVKFKHGKDRNKMAFALHKLTFRRQITTSWQYEVARKLNVEAVKKSWDDPEFRNKQSKSRTRTWSDPEVRSNLSTSMKNFWTPDRINSTREVRQKLWADPVRRQRLSDKVKLAWSDPDLRQKQSERLSKLSQSPERRQQLSEAGKKGAAAVIARRKL